MKHAFVALVFAVGCGSSSKNVEPKPTPDPVPTEDEKIEFAKQKGLTDSFSYRRMSWETSMEDFSAAMTQPTSINIYSNVTFLTFDTSTQSVDTSLTAGFWDSKLVTIDIAPKEASECAIAIPKWQKALTIKYGPPADVQQSFVAWKLADASRIVIETGDACSIIYARDAKTRVEVNNAVKTKTK